MNQIVKIALGTAAGICVVYFGYIAIGWVSKEWTESTCRNQAVAELGNNAKVMDLIPCMARHGYRLDASFGTINWVKAE